VPVRGSPAAAAFALVSLRLPCAEQGRAPEQQVEEGELGEGDDDEEASASQEPEPKRKSLLPASLGVSVFVPDALRKMSSPPG